MRAEARSRVALYFAKLRLYWLRERLVTRIPDRNRNRPDRIGDRKHATFPLMGKSGGLATYDRLEVVSDNHA
jgi:hypothetical protein